MSEAKHVGPLRARAMWLVAIAAALGAVSGTATAADAEARVEPPEAPAGTPVRLVLAVRDASPAEAWVLPEIACEVRTPDGRTDTPCESTGSLAEVRILSEGVREYTFPYDGSREAGSYEVAFRLVSAVTVPVGTMTADATFAALGKALEGADLIEKALDPSAPRWLASIAGAAAAGSVAIASAITPRRGSP